MKETSERYSKVLGMTGLEAYAIDAAVVRWGSAFSAAIKEATAEAKTQGEAERRASQTIRRWVPSSRKYR
jgi:hypothetical protein